MGVKGLTSYIKQAPKSFGDRINISERAAESPNGKFNLAVDGRAFLYWLIEDGAGIDCSTRNQSFCWGDTLMLKWGGDMVELAKTLSNAINQLKGAGVQPFFVFDGSQASHAFTSLFGKKYSLGGSRASFVSQAGGEGSGGSNGGHEAAEEKGGGEDKESAGDKK